MRRQVSDLHKRSEQNKKENIDVRMLAEEEVTLLQQQQTALRDALKISEKKSEEVKRELVKEVRVPPLKATPAVQAGIPILPAD